jgi:hypothetical protein
MIPNDQPLRSQTIKRMIDYLIKNLERGSRDLTEWESDFVNSIYEQFEERGDLSSKQCEILERLYDK